MDFKGLKIQEHPPAQDKGTRVWLITFTDLVALMLTFFVMVFAMSSVKVSKWQNVIDSLSQTLRPTQEKTVPAATSSFNIGTIFRKRAINLDYLASVLAESFEGHALLSNGRLMRLEDRLIISLPGDLLFETGQAETTERGREAMFVLGGVLRNIGNSIGINGHAGPEAAVGGGYASEWELTTARAAAVANVLSHSGYTEDITAYGYGASRAGDLSDLPEPTRTSLNRRIDIVVRPTAGGS
ncbi:MAG: OmpA family protein [Rhodospirillales bacterium]|nr:OmpA family protein [Rhodospirillales bacterium]